MFCGKPGFSRRGRALVDGAFRGWWEGASPQGDQPVVPTGGSAPAPPPGIDSCLRRGRLCLRRNDGVNGPECWERRKGWGMEGPGRLREKASTPVAMRGVRPWGRFTSATTLRQPRTSERMWRRREDGLAVGQSRPPEVLDHPKGWERGPVTGVRRPEISDGDDGGIRLKWCVGFESELVRLFGLASKG